MTDWIYGAWERDEFRMTLRFLTKAARWIGTLYLPSTETWMTEKAEWILVGEMACPFLDMVNLRFLEGVPVDDQ